MHVPFDDKRGIHPQDDTFLDREVWDLAATPRGKFPLMLHYHPLVIYRYQVLKQSDVVLAMFLLGNEFSEEQKRRNFEYYDPLTTGDSSLSACVQSIIAAEIGKHREALEYFEYALLMDLANVAGNASDGVHIAAAAGVWSSLVSGFGGVRDFGGRLSFAPRLPRDWTELAFSLRFRDRQIRVQLTHDEERYLLDEGAPLEVTIRGEPHLLIRQAISGLTWAFTGLAGWRSGYVKVSGMAVPMSWKAWRWALVGSVSIAMVTWVPVYRTWLRVKVARCSSRPRKLR